MLAGCSWRSLTFLSYRWPAAFIVLEYYEYSVPEPISVIVSSISCSFRELGVVARTPTHAAQPRAALVTHQDRCRLGAGGAAACTHPQWLTHLQASDIANTTLGFAEEVEVGVGLTAPIVDLATRGGGQAGAEGSP